MGLLHDREENEYKGKEDKKQIIQDLNLNAFYRNDAVYNECSYEIRNILTDAKKTNKSKKATSYSDFNSSFTWSKVYKSPIIKKKKIINTDSECVFYKKPRPESEYSAVKDKRNVKQSDKAVEHVKTKNANTLVRSTLTIPRRTSQLIITKKSQYKTILPKLLCPCCCWGEDKIENVYAHNLQESYENIDLINNPDNALQYLDLDESVLSMIDLQIKLISKRTRKKYTTIVKQALYNAYVDTIKLLSRPKII